MNTQILYSKELVEHEYKLIQADISSHKFRAPKLCIVQVGDDASSNLYIRNKKNACKKIGADFELIKLSSDTSFMAFKNILNKLNSDSSVDGYLVQLPTNLEIQQEDWTALIDPSKDVDGFHPNNIYNLYQNKHLNETLLPCTPQGVLFLLDRYNIPYDGKTVCIAGRSLIVGKPLEQLFQSKNATTILCHSKTKNILQLINSTDIFISAIGKPKYFNASQITNKNLTIIDVGINVDENGSLCGDVDFQSMLGHVRAVSPVPGGVGPLTVLFLIKNLIKTWKIRNQL
jgi:methylenetetrahydrofolate dehydrogenase (NADP+) / methenyltetrahydrofolate cyclohydrolase